MFHFFATKNDLEIWRKSEIQNRYITLHISKNKKLVNEHLKNDSHIGTVLINMKPRTRREWRYVRKCLELGYVFAISMFFSSLFTPLS